MLDEEYFIKLIHCHLIPFVFQKNDSRQEKGTKDPNTKVFQKSHTKAIMLL